MHTVAADGTTYQASGSGPVVVLVHGLGLNRHMWQWQTPALAAHFRVVAWDLFGHGDSPPPPGRPDLAMFSGQLATLLDDIGADRAAVVGFSLGGMIARRFALDHPGRLSALAILNSVHDRTPGERKAVRDRVEQAAEAGPAATIEAALERWFTPGWAAGHPETMALVRGWVSANDPAFYSDLYRVLAEGDIELARAIREISCRTLVMTGGDDSGNSPEMAGRMAALIPGARAIVLPGLRHMGLVEDPDRFTGPLLSFLRSALEPPAES